MLWYSDTLCLCFLAVLFVFQTEDIFENTAIFNKSTIESLQHCIWNKYFQENRKQRKKQTRPNLGINFLRDLCPEAVLCQYPDIKLSAQKPEVQFEIFGNTWNFSASLSKVCSPSQVIKTVQRGKINRVENRVKISLGKKWSFYHSFFNSAL